MEAASRLSQGVEFDYILDDIRDNVGEKLCRIQLLTRKDLTNIEKAYHLRRIQRHSDDATSVRAWVEEMKTEDCNPVLLYKAQGDNQQNNCKNLNGNDFVLVLQTPLQAEMMKQFSKIVCVDSTHGTNGYDFNLISIIIVDEFGKGYPVAWCLANREDGTLLKNFYDVVKMKVGSIQPEWFMSDDAEQFYSAWVSTFENEPKKLLCTWHVDRAWRENLVFTRQLQATIYHNLRVLLEETDTATFETLLHATLQNLSTYTGI